MAVAGFILTYFSARSGKYGRWFFPVAPVPAELGLGLPAHIKLVKVEVVSSLPPGCEGRHITKLSWKRYGNSGDAE